MTPMIFHGKQRKLVMQYSYVKWSKVKLLAGLKQKKSTASEEQIHRDTHPDPLPILVAKKKKQGQTYQKSAKSMPCVYFNDNSCTFTKHHETKGVFAVLVLHRMARSAFIAPVIAKNQ